MVLAVLPKVDSCEERDISFGVLRPKRVFYPVSDSCLLLRVSGSLEGTQLLERCHRFLVETLLGLRALLFDEVKLSGFSQIFLAHLDLQFINSNSFNYLF